MPLKATLTEDQVNALPAHLKPEYKLDEKAKVYRLDVEPVGGWALEDVAGLKTVLSDRTERHKEAAAKVAAYGDLTPEQAREAVEKLKALGDMGDKAKLDKIVADMTGQVEKKYQSEIEKRDKALSTLSQQLERQIVDGELARLISGSGDPRLKGASFPLLIGAIRSQVKVEKVQTADGEGLAARVMDPKTGAPLLSRKQGDNGPMGLEEYLLMLREDPKYAPAFPGSGSTGSGSAGAANGVGGMSVAELAKMPPEARAKYLRKQGATK